METFIQPKVTGYRQLNENEANLMNAIKSKGAELGDLINQLETTNELDQRFVSIGKTQIQLGFMSLIRGVAQPTSFV